MIPSHKGLDYNTARKQMPLPEYGRNVQQMVDYLLTIKNRAERTAQAHVVLSVMRMLAPHLRNIEDYERKLWDHMFIMSDFKLDVDSPYPMPEQSEVEKNPDRVPYPQHQKEKLSHYGAISAEMLKRIAAMPPSESRDELLRMVANHMKRCHMLYNKRNVSDEEVMRDVSRLSKGRISLSEDQALLTTETLAGKGGGKQQSRQSRASAHAGSSGERRQARSTSSGKGRERRRGRPKKKRV